MTAGIRRQNEWREWKGFMQRKLKLLYISSEISPYAATGGLGEVAKGFPEALLQTGEVEVRRVMPLYRSVEQKLEYVTDFPVEMGKDYDTCLVKADSQREDILTYFIENHRYFYRDNIYGYEDDGIRYFFFCKSVVELLKRIPYHPDIVHTNDWHTGFLPLLLKKEFPNIKTVFTIHNICYQGYIPATYLSDIISLKEKYILGWPEWLNFMKAGIIYSDLLTTVSKGYSEEVSQPAYSYGMAPFIKKRKNGIIGIQNGIDTSLYNPSREDDLEFPYDSRHPERKQKNKELLCREYGLGKSEKPLVAMITRLDYSKGIDTVIQAISYFDFRKFNLVVLGSGSAEYSELLTGFTEGFEDSVALDFHYSPKQAKKIYAAADIYLMPSLFEPCGLGQLYAMRYGAVPVVNPVGGLKDTVIDKEENPEEHTGFYMEEWSGEALNKALDRAIAAYHSPKWKQYRKNCMEYDSSWKRGIDEYLKQYRALLS